MSLVPHRPGRSTPPVTAAFLSRVVSTRFDGDHVVSGDGKSWFPVLLAPVKTQAGYVSAPACWGWSETAGHQLSLDAYRVMMAATGTASDGTFALVEDVTTSTGNVVPKGTVCRVQIAESGTALEIACSGPPAAPQTTQATPPNPGVVATPTPSHAPPVDPEQATPPNPG